MVQSDIYSNFIPIIKNAIYEYVEKGGDAIVNNFDIDRAFVKKPIMTIPYSISIFGIKQQLVTNGHKVGKGYYEFTNKKNIKFLVSSKVLKELSAVIYKTIIKTFPVLKDLFSYYQKMSGL